MKVLRRLLLILPHAVIVIALMMLTFSIINKINTAMGFINHPMTEGLLIAFAILTLLADIYLLSYQIAYGRYLLCLIPLPSVLSSIGAILLVLYNHRYPAANILTKPLAENLIIADAIAALIAALFLFAMNRIMLARRNRKECLK